MELKDTWLLARISTVLVAHSCHKVKEKITKTIINLPFHFWYIKPSLPVFSMCKLQDPPCINSTLKFWKHFSNIWPQDIAWCCLISIYVWGGRLGFLDLLCIRSHVLDRPDNLPLILYLSPQIAVWPKHSISGLAYLIHSFRYSSHYAGGEILPNVFRL